MCCDSEIRLIKEEIPEKHLILLHCKARHSNIPPADRLRAKLVVHQLS